MERRVSGSLREVAGGSALREVAGGSTLRETTGAYDITGDVESGSRMAGVVSAVVPKAEYIILVLLAAVLIALACADGWKKDAVVVSCLTTAALLGVLKLARALRR